MALVGISEFNLVLENARTLLANCASFQTWTDTADAAAAKLRIPMYGEMDEHITHPVAAIYFGEDNAWQASKIAGGEGADYWSGGDLDIIFIADVPVAYQGNEAGKFQDAFMDHMNDVGVIVHDLKALAFTDSYLNVTAITKVSGPVRWGKPEESKRAQVVIRLSWEGLT